MLSLLIEVKLEIASKDPDVWYIMYRYDPEFARLAQSKYGISRYIEIFTTVEITPHMSIYRLFGKVNRAGDLPSIVTDEGSTYWHRDGYLHRSPYGDVPKGRDNDQPAVIQLPSTKSWDLAHVKNTQNIVYGVEKGAGRKAWFCNGVMHRSVGPALIYDDGTCAWYWWGTLCAAKDGDTMKKCGLLYDEQFGVTSFH